MLSIRKTAAADFFNTICQFQTLEIDDVQAPRFKEIDGSSVDERYDRTVERKEDKVPVASRSQGCMLQGIEV